MSMSTGAFVQAAWSPCNFVLKRVALPHPNDWTADVGDEVKDGVGLEAVDEGGEKQRRGENLIVGRGKGSTVANHVLQRISCSW